MMLRAGLVLLLAFLMSVPSARVSAWTLRAVSADPVVLAYEAAPEGQGLGLELARMLLDRLGADAAQFRAEPIPGTRRARLFEEGSTPLCSFFHVRSPAREAARHWVAEMSYGQTVLVRLGDGPDLPGPGEPVLVFAGSHYEAMARQEGWMVEPMRVRDHAGRMLSTGRVQWWLEELSVVRQAEVKGLVPPVRVTKAFAPIPAWLACSLSVPEPHLLRLRAAFNSLLADGSYAALLAQVNLPMPRPEGGVPGQ
ncbi:ABC transporter substrate-binding protein [Aerophototrophica crusticola]|uniref:ABC transporter substrate-binding protein n=1 Tax=Aerophototrophica crusticola TaxID=1709002 RepID=A0A858R879_9PROT|nr:ABC transporter substrate-binding protein [Rhodospirillaceae bacterium B3]